MNVGYNDLICAVATPQGSGAISIIRLSGDGAWACVENLFSKELLNKSSHTVHFGIFLSASQEMIDEVLVTLFAKGKSYTGEESVEISCHASPYVQQQILRELMATGCRIAEPGEFTQRAFLNGNLDLSQAEAVADLIASQSKRAHEIALNQLRGRFSTELKDLRERLIHFASLVELELDFSEEDVEFADRTELNKLVTEVLGYIERLIASFELGNAIRNGVPVAIVGAPNTGKSTLLNQLLGEDRAIVSDIAGTTRDVIEEVINIDGIAFRLIDTAGIREGAETIEAMGIQRSKEKIKQAKIVLCMADVSKETSVAEVRQWTKELQEKHTDKTVLTVINKLDLAPNVSLLENEIGISAMQGDHIEALTKKMSELVKGDFNSADETIVSNERHYEALLKTSDALRKAKEGLETNITGDFVAMDIRQAMYHLGSITGDISTDDLLGNIFAKFCIGK